MRRHAEWKDLGVHAGRVAMGFGLLALGRERLLVAVLGAAFLYFAAFSFLHDLNHGALRLPRRLNEVLIAGVGLLMLSAGHGMRLLHLRHHARPMAADDVEGEGAALSWGQALLQGPSNAIRYRVVPFQFAQGSERRWLVAENVGSAALLGLALAFGRVGGAVWVSMIVALHLSAGLWASHLPHHPPALLVRLAHRLEWSHSSIVLSFLHHERHHAAPWIPCAQLAER